MNHHCDILVRILNYRCPLAFFGPRPTTHIVFSALGAQCQKDRAPVVSRDTPIQADQDISNAIVQMREENDFIYFKD